MCIKQDRSLDQGVYVLWLYLPEDTEISIGRLGIRVFPPGVYGYCGSAQRNLQARVRRHVRENKRLRWHIDYFREHSLFLGASVFLGDRSGECRLTQQLLLLPGSYYPMKGFGASDCTCCSHFVFVSAVVPSGSSGASFLATE